MTKAIKTKKQKPRNPPPLEVRCPTCGKEHKVYFDLYRLCSECAITDFERRVIQHLEEMRGEMRIEIRDKFHHLLDLMAPYQSPEKPEKSTKETIPDSAVDSGD